MMPDTKITRQQALDAISCLPYSDRGNSALSVAQGYLTQLEQEGALLRARVEELEGTLDYERTGHAHIAQLVGVSEWDPQAVCDAIIRERAKVEAALEAAQNYLRTTSLALSQAGQRAIEREVVIEDRDSLCAQLASAQQQLEMVRGQVEKAIAKTLDAESLSAEQRAYASEIDRHNGLLAALTLADWATTIRAALTLDAPEPEAAKPLWGTERSLVADMEIERAEMQEAEACAAQIKETTDE